MTVNSVHLGQFLHVNSGYDAEYNSHKSAVCHKSATENFVMGDGGRKNSFNGDVSQFPCRYMLRAFIRNHHVEHKSAQP